MKGLRNYINSIKPNFVGEGKYSKWFPLFDAVENFVFSTQTKTSNPVHVRDGVDIQKNNGNCLVIYFSSDVFWYV